MKNFFRSSDTQPTQEIVDQEVELNEQDLEQVNGACGDDDYNDCDDGGYWDCYGHYHYRRHHHHYCY